jgi:hypothetical protein
MLMKSPCCLCVCVPPDFLVLNALRVCVCVRLCDCVSPNFFVFYLVRVCLCVWLTAFA